jgi:surface polysaccharide O-acyltransferase-like enzyme
MNAERVGMVKARQSNFELLRIVAMLGVVLGHMFTEGHLLSHAEGGALAASVVLGCGARVSVNLFVLAGCWFLVDATRPGAGAFAPGRRWWRLHFTVLCWTAPLTVAALALGARAETKDVVRGFLPYFGRPLWFASAWMSLLLAVPFLRKALEWDGRKLGGAVAVGGMVIVLNSTLADFREGYLTDTCWFLYMYLFVGWARLHAPGWAKRVPGWAMLLGGMALYAAMAGPEWWARANDTGATKAAAKAVHKVAEWYLADIKSAPNFLCALGFFGFFAKMDIGSVRWINAVARPAFAVYVAHQTPAFWPVLWKKIAGCPGWWGRPWAPLAAVGVALAIYAAVGIVESLRLRWVELPWTRSGLFRRLAGAVDRMVGEG